MDGFDVSLYLSFVFDSLVGPLATVSANEEFYHIRTRSVEVGEPI